MKRVIRVKPVANHMLELVFSDNEMRLFDVSPYLCFGIFQELRDESYFNQVALQLDSVAWPNGQDFSPETLYIKGVFVEPYPTEYVKPLA